MSRRFEFYASLSAPGGFLVSMRRGILDILYVPGFLCGVSGFLGVPCSRVPGSIFSFSRISTAERMTLGTMFQCLD